MNVISCSRRTDIPRCYPEWLEGCLAEGQVEFQAPRGGWRRQALGADDVHSFVMWSKDYRPLLARNGLVKRLQTLNPFFHFTTTGLGGSPWEPVVTDWRSAVGTMSKLADRFGPERINWRFDPIVFWKDKESVVSNIGLFGEIGSEVAANGIKTCTFSFAHWYAKSVRRANKADLVFFDPEPDEKIERAGSLAEQAVTLGIELASCCNETLEEVPGIAKARCVDAALLSALRKDGLPAPAATDTAQRNQCGCSKSVDIGSYLQRCHEPACVYCYAN